MNEKHDLTGLVQKKYIAIGSVKLKAEILHSIGVMQLHIHHKNATGMIE